MKGSYVCPHCKTRNACTCESCIGDITPEEVAVKFTDDGEAMICGKCQLTFSFDQAINEEFKSIDIKLF